MARPRKPSALLELSGAFDHDPQRRRKDEPQETRPLGKPPARIPPEVLPYWDEIVEMVPGGVLTYRDRWAVEIAARLMAKQVRGLPSLTASPEIISKCQLDANQVKRLLAGEKITSSELSTLRSLLAALGMTPGDRSKLSVATSAKESKPENQFAALESKFAALDRQVARQPHE